MSKTKTKKTKRKQYKPLTHRQINAVNLAAHMMNTSPLPDFVDSGDGRNNRVDEITSRIEDALIMAHHLVEYVRKNV